MKILEKIYAFLCVYFGRRDYSRRMHVNEHKDYDEYCTCLQAMLMQAIVAKAGGHITVDYDEIANLNGQWTVMVVSDGTKRTFSIDMIPSSTYQPELP